MDFRGPFRDIGNRIAYDVPQTRLFIATAYFFMAYFYALQQIVLDAAPPVSLQIPLLCVLLRTYWVCGNRIRFPGSD